MPVLPNAKHELFAQALAKGATADAAYVKAGYKAHRGNAATLRANQSIQDRVVELKGQAAKAVVFGLQDAIKFCVDVVQAKPEDASASNPLCEVKMSKAGPYYAFPDKNNALDKLAKMLGFYAPEEKNLNVVAETAEDREQRRQRAKDILTGQAGHGAGILG